MSKYRKVTDRGKGKDSPRRNARPAGKGRSSGFSDQGKDRAESGKGSGRSSSSSGSGKKRRPGARPERERGGEKVFTRDKNRRSFPGQERDRYERRSADDKGTERPRKSYPVKDRKASSGIPKKRSDGKYFSPGEGGLKERRKRIGQDEGRYLAGQQRDKNENEKGQRWNRKESHELYGDRRRSKTRALQKAPSERANPETGVRLNKFIANAGICSRREADELIAAGVVSVNGETVTEMGYKVQAGDVVKYNNETLRGERPVYILLNKPKDFITTMDDPDERKTVMSLIAKAGSERVYPVGRLDRNTTGVLLFTNDGELAARLTHPSFEVQKIYQVELDKPLKKQDLDRILEGIHLPDGFIKVDEIAYTSGGGDIVGVELHSGRNRIVRRIFESLEYKVKKLDRVVFAGLTKKDLPRGRWRFLTDMEVANLKMITGKKKQGSKNLHG